MKVITIKILLLFIGGVVFFTSCQQKSGSQYDTWGMYNGSNDGIKYSSLNQIDTTNVGDLQIAWEYKTGDADTINKSQIQCNPIIVKGTLYGTSPKLKLFALNAATGKQKWVFDPLIGDSTNKGSNKIESLNNSRGIAYWSDNKDRSRIYYTVGSRLFSINAETGEMDKGFGENGTVDLHLGLGKDVEDLYITSTSPGIVYKNLLIMGSRVDEGAKAAPGHIRAYDVITGEQKWLFHTIPHPGEFGYNTWEDPEAYKHLGGANAWSGFSLDEENGIVFTGTGSASFDFYGGKRLGSNLFANSILALNAATGERIWHYQTIHHDLWDRDLPAPPILVTLNKDGKKIDAVVQVSKGGHVFVLERKTGKPIYPIEETPVPTDIDVVGERVWPTQPIPTIPKPFARQVFTEQEINHLLPKSSQADIKKRLATYRNGNMFNPPTKQGTVYLPGTDGGAEWGGASFDPNTGILYVNSNEMAWIITLMDVSGKKENEETLLKAGLRLYRNNCTSCHGTDLKGTGNYPSLINIKEKYNESEFSSLLLTGRRMMPAFKQLDDSEKRAIASYVLELESIQNEKFSSSKTPSNSYTDLPYTITGYNKFLSSEGLPAIRPPWGTLNAINLNTGEFVWKVPLGRDPAFPDEKTDTGTENYGGSVITSGGLLFIAATKDRKMRAFNKLTGKILWETELPASGFATPSIYQADGKQYVVIASGGGKLGTKSGDSYVAYALP